MEKTMEKTMKKTMKKLLGVGALLFVATNVQAGIVKTTSDQIKTYRVGSSGRVVTIYTNVRNTVNPASCVRDYPVQISQVSGNGVGEKAYDQMLASIMAAKISDRPVVLFISDNKCNGNYPSVIYVGVE